ncbi:MAG: recombination mediator RecR [Syntrophomonas sp.]
MRLARPLENLIDKLLLLPTIGPKTAQRLALFILKLPEEESMQLAHAIVDCRKKVFPCPSCGYLTDQEPCVICRDDSRDKKIMCVAEAVGDVLAIERSGFRGRYFVLNKDFNLMEDKGLEDVDLKPLVQKLASGEVEEVILALNPDIEGEIMARYLARIAARHQVKVSRLAHGLPVGGDIEFADELTLRRAFEGRKEF